MTAVYIRHEHVHVSKAIESNVLTQRASVSQLKGATGMKWNNDKKNHPYVS